ncbi:hypothetical protein A7A08_02313 [Methyloligella halotolerans]|uniref:Uncharacterized protein n=1 Tax=Methyloligella halotolerans TaxID=1177755 RepID=A0A1E2RXP5_9HYPH|nr:hypothetical protein [Methyloligella halotolerans]ODA67016.1 hypothetical protein A7A08_02313 [Methyloligella halotolerans]
MQMKFWALAALFGSIIGPLPASADNDGSDPTDQVYLQIIVKACHATETLLQPTNQGVKYDDVQPLSREERLAMYREIGCIDVPIPMRFITGRMNAGACRGHAGYMAAMQFLEQRSDLAEYPAVGAWECILSDKPVVSPVGQ